MQATTHQDRNAPYSCKCGHGFLSTNTIAYVEGHLHCCPQAKSHGMTSITQILLHSPSISSPANSTPPAPLAPKAHTPSPTVVCNFCRHTFTRAEMYDHKHYIVCKQAHSRAENAEATKCPQCDQFFIKGALLRHLKQKGNEECWRKWAVFVMDQDGCGDSGGRLRIKKGGQGVKGKGKAKEEVLKEDAKKEMLKADAKKEMPKEEGGMLNEKKEMPKEKEEMSKEEKETHEVTPMQTAPTTNTNKASQTKGGERKIWAFNSSEVYRAGLLPPQLRKPREEGSEAMEKDEDVGSSI